MSYIVPIGPYHPALEEPIHAKLYTEGEVIKDAEVFVGYNHRGIEKLATERNAIQTLVLVERVCGICSHSHAFTYAMCVENINGVEVPKRGQYIRVITAELERLHSHFLWLGIACHIIGHDSMFMHIWDERELVMDLLETAVRDILLAQAGKGSLEESGYAREAAAYARTVPLAGGLQLASCVTRARMMLASNVAFASAFESVLLKISEEYTQWPW